MGDEWCEKKCNFLKIFLSKTDSKVDDRLYPPTSDNRLKNAPASAEQSCIRPVHMSGKEN